MWLTEDGTLYIAESGAAKFRVITSSGIISTVAGSGSVGFGGDGGSCTAPSVKMNSPCGCYVNNNVNCVMYTAESAGVILKIYD
jgi:hypothetical protein